MLFAPAGWYKVVFLQPEMVEVEWHVLVPELSPSMYLLLSADKL